jgi:hypothetical protein
VFGVFVLALVGAGGGMGTGGDLFPVFDDSFATEQGPGRVVADHVNCARARNASTMPARMARAMRISRTTRRFMAVG